MPHAEKFRNHIAQLCATHGITITHTVHRSGSAYAAKRPVPTIGINPVSDTLTYAEALHEIGHLVAPGAFPDHPLDIYSLCKYGLAVRADIETAIVEEEAAWAWAMEHAIAWTDAMSARRAKGMASYYRVRDRTDDRCDPIMAMAVYAMTDHHPESQRAQLFRMVAAERLRAYGIDPETYPASRFDTPVGV